MSSTNPDCVIVRPFPVLYACAGCPQFGYSARRVAQWLDERGLVQAVWLGDAPSTAVSRYPIHSLDACDRRCARAWLRERGAAVQLAMELSSLDRLDPESAAERIAARI